MQYIKIEDIVDGKKTRVRTDCEFKNLPPK